MLNAEQIIRMHDRDTTEWHGTAASSPSSGAGDFQALAERQHRANYDLWHEEDKARSPDSSCADITEVKHAIDRLNQLRNDLVEQMDSLLLTEASHQNEASPLHSETPGLIVDRLSILALKIYHTAEEAHRATASEEHRRRNRQRLETLTQQRDDLAGCLHELWQQILKGQRRFKLYRQMKMYNDPELNPVLYGSSRQ